MKKNHYQSPQLTVVQFKTEKGYATSDIKVAFGELDLAASHFIEERLDQGALWSETFNTTGTIEDRTAGSTFGGSDWNTNDASYF